MVPTLETPVSFLEDPSQTESAPVVTKTVLPTQSARIDIQKAKQAYDHKEAVFVDVRTIESFEANHIPGALSIPLNELSTRWMELKQDDWIITYCT